MKIALVSLAMIVAAAGAAHAQVPVTANADHEAMLRHADPQLAKNKRLVYDFWREVFEAANMDLATATAIFGDLRDADARPGGRSVTGDRWRCRRAGGPSAAPP